MNILPIAVDDWIIERIVAGDSQRAIAEALGRSAAWLCGYLAKPHIAERSAYARTQSAEAWLDRGLRELEQARDSISGSMGDSAMVQAARAIAQECARRAAIRNPAYKEKAEVAVTGKDGGPLRVAAIAVSVTAEEASRVYQELLG